MEYWWRYPIVSGAKAQSGQSGQSDIATAIAEAFPSPDLEHVIPYAVPTVPGVPQLSEEDERLVEGVNRQTANIVTQIKAVVDGATNAFFIWGPGGHGKAHV
ncbi:hypothetical protein LCGC14_2774110, partial [marine sediment metagenome]